MKKKIIFVILLMGCLLIYLEKNKISQNIPKAPNKQIVNNKDKDYKEKYKDDYEKIKFYDKENFLKNVNLLLDNKYSTKEINNINKYLSAKNINKLIKLNKYIDISKYLKIKNFNVDNYDRYEKYLKNNKNLEINKVVTYVNIDLDIPDYTDMNTIENPDDFFVIVNKHNKLPDGYIPSDLVAYNKNNTLRTTVKKEVIDPLKEFFEASKVAGHELYQTTSYRDYKWQNNLYTNYVNNDGVEKADTYSARPGNSEHQTGYAVDLAAVALMGGNQRLTKEDEEWIKDNCYKYGFILRYTEENKEITRYMAESWHIRYVGKEAAEIINKENLSLEEYVDLYINEY